LAYCKFAHALSSSGRSQSLASTLSESNIVSEIFEFVLDATILISPFTALMSTLPVRPLSSSKGFGMRIPFELPIVIIEVFICNYIIVTYNE
jgi:hypothetical protein